LKIKPELIVLLCRWGIGLKRTNAMGLLVKAGRSGGTHAHKDIAFNFVIDSDQNFKSTLLH